MPAGPGLQDTLAQLAEGQKGDKKGGAMLVIQCLKLLSRFERQLICAIAGTPQGNADLMRKTRILQGLVASRRSGE